MFRFYYVGDLSPYGLAVSVIGSLPWFLTWARPEWSEVALIFLFGAAMQPLLLWLSRELHKWRDPAAVAGFDYQLHGVLTKNSANINREDFIKMIDGWAGSRVLFTCLSSLLRDVPLAVFAYLGPVQRTPEPHESAMLQVFHFAGFYGFLCLLVFIEQSIVAAKLKSAAAAHLREPALAGEGVPWQIQRQLGAFEMLFASISWTISMAAAWMTLRHGAGLVQKGADVVSLSGFGLIFLGGVWAWSILLLRQYREKQFLQERVTDYELESKLMTRFAADKARFAELGQFTGLVVHDLGSSLAVMRLSLENLAREISLLNPEAEHLKVLEASASHMDSLVQALRAKLRNRDGEGAGQCVLGDSIDRALTLLKMSSEGGQPLNWEVDVSEDIRALVVAMPRTELMQIIMNLAGNSIKSAARRMDGKVWISLLSKVDGFVELSLRDNGHGLTRERFEQLTSVGLRSSDLSFVHEGLGLRLVCRLIECYGGSLHATEESGPDGACLVMRLPFVDK
jgi:signal transduction histidine kinase